MAQVTATINGRDYQIACADGEEEHVCNLLDTIAGHVSALVQDVGQVGEAQLLLFAALVLADELDELHQEYELLEAGNEEEEQFGGEDHAAVSALISRIDAVAARLQNP